MSAPFPVRLIPLLPLAGALINLALGRRCGKFFTSFVGCLSVAGAMVLAWHGALLLWHSADWAVLRDTLFSGDWIASSELNGDHALHIQPGLMLDRLSATMALVVTTVGFLIHLYSTAYMEEDEGYARYFGYLNLFTGAMLLLVLGDSLLVTFVGWEGVGLCSYLLIGFWFSKEANATAGRKAFIVNRVGDFGFLLGMLLLLSVTGTLTYEGLAEPASLASLRTHYYFGGTFATLIGLLLFFGCTGKSAQIPLYVWLPDAMAGPTPVSALIHAATMVTAGVYMVARLYFLFALDPFVMGTIAVIGAATALFAATMALAARPLKKILAYSTISQIGFMFIGVGTGAYAAGMFHLVTHAFFKAGLFLGAGAIMHALGGEEDVMNMGGLGRKLPLLRYTFLIYALALAGIVPFAGFFSKDAILGSAFLFDFSHFSHWPHWLGQAIYSAGMAAAFCTALYIFRAYFLIFSGTYRGAEEKLAHLHRPGSAMTIPLVILALGSVGLGLLGLPGEHNFLHAWFPTRMLGREPTGQMAWGLMIIASGVSLFGISSAWMLYGNGPTAGVARLAKTPLHHLLARKYYIDEIYHWAIVKPLRTIAWFLWHAIDDFLIDLICVRGSAAVVDHVGMLLRYLQTGNVQHYLTGLAVGTACLVLVGSNWVSCSASKFQVDSKGTDVTVRAARILDVPLPLPVEYTFDFGDGSPPLKQLSSTARHHYAAAGEKRIRVTARDPRWNTSARQTRQVVLP